MSGFPRDLAVLEPWELSLHRSRERRQGGWSWAHSQAAWDGRASFSLAQRELDVKNQAELLVRERHGRNEDR
jgi:hypothetical protein